MIYVIKKLSKLEIILLSDNEYIMCLYRITKSFDPYYSDDNTEAYKIFWFDGHSLRSPYRHTSAEYNFNQWYEDIRNDLLQSKLERNYPDLGGYQPRNNFDDCYRSGFHCYTNLKDAKLAFKGYHEIAGSLYILVKVKLKNVIVLGYEQYDGFFKKKLDIIVAKNMFIYSDILLNNQDKPKRKLIFL